MLRTHRTIVIKAVSLVVAVTPLAGCGDDDDDGADTGATTTTAAPDGASTSAAGETSAPVAGETTTTSVATTPPPDTTCQVSWDEPDPVGSVDDVVFDEVTMDCEIVGDDEPVHVGSEIRTDAEGVVDLVLGSGWCRLRPRLAIEVRRRADDVEAAVLEGSDSNVDCNIQLAIGADLIEPGTTADGEQTVLSLQVMPDGSWMLVSADGPATVRRGTSCVTIGAAELVEPAAAGTLRRAPIDEISAELAETLARHGRTFALPESQLPDEVAAAIDADAATLAVDGEDVDVDDDLPTAVGSFLDVASFDLSPPVNAPLDPADPSPPATGPVAASTVPTTAPPERETLPILVDPGGRTWTADLLAGSAERELVRQALDHDVRSGAYGRDYFREFGQLPDYDVLLGDETAC